MGATMRMNSLPRVWRLWAVLCVFLLRSAELSDVKANLSSCASASSCEECTSKHSWMPGTRCRWCPKDRLCHAYGSTKNPCSSSEERTDPSKCGAEPSQIHISFAGEGGMRVAWFTWNAAESAVRYGTKSGELTMIANATYAARNYLPGLGFHHVVKLAGLSAGTVYYYRPGSDAGGFSAEEFSFRTAPAAKSEAAFQVSVFGDLGYEDSTRRPMLVHGIDGLVDSWSAQFSRNRLAALQDARSIDFVWHLGDVGYADDSFAHSPLDLSYETAYNGFQDWMQNLSARCPYMVSPGNHESECHSPECLTHIDSIGKPLANFTAYNARWHMPSLESGARARQSMWYSWDYGGVHFVSINSETDWPGAEEEKTGDGHFKSLPAGSFGQAGEYLAWLRADLTQAATSREKTGWPRYIVAGGHRPYSDIQPLHTDLFAEFGVDLYVAGHAHSYKRY